MQTYKCAVLQKQVWQKNGFEWCKNAMDGAYVPIPYLEKEFEPMQWMHFLANLDICTINHGIKFYDKEGYDIIPI